MKPFRARRRDKCARLLLGILSSAHKTVYKLKCRRAKKLYLMMDYPFHLECTHLSYGAPRIWNFSSLWLLGNGAVTHVQKKIKDDPQGFKLGSIRPKYLASWIEIWQIMEIISINATYYVKWNYGSTSYFYGKAKYEIPEWSHFCVAAWAAIPL